MLVTCDWLARHSQNARDEIGLVRFAERAETTPAVRARKARSTIGRSLARGGDLGSGTQLSPAVTGMCCVLAGAARERTVALLITDGQVAESDAELRILLARLRALADAVYLIALDGDGAWRRETHARYDSLGLAGVVPIERASRADLAEVLADILLRETGLAIERGSGRP